MPQFEKFAPKGIRESKGEFTAHTQTTEELGKGVEGTVKKVDVELSRGERVRTITLAQKTFDTQLTEGYRKEFIAGILEKNAALKDRRIPTVPTMRSEKDNDKVMYMTDLTQGGTHEVISANDWGRGIENHEGKFYKNQNNFFISNPEEIVNGLNEIFLKSVASGVGFHTDTIFLQIDKKTKKARALLGDISGVSFTEGLDAKSRQGLMERNYRYLQNFIKLTEPHLRSIRPLDTRILKDSRRRLLAEAKSEAKRENGPDRISILKRIRTLLQR